MEELKACPCCGHKATLHQIGPKMVISCARCGIKLEKMYMSKRDLIKSWNKRVN